MTLDNCYSNIRPERSSRVGGLYEGFISFNASIKKGFSITYQGIPQIVNALANAWLIFSLFPISKELPTKLSNDLWSEGFESFLLLFLLLNPLLSVSRKSTLARYSRITSLGALEQWLAKWPSNSQGSPRSQCLSQ